MKVNRLETHDRLLEFNKQRDDIGICCQNIINQRPFGDLPFYIFAHKREIGMDEKFNLLLSGQFNDGEVPSARIIWQPRLTKPEAQENSMLFKGYPGTDMVKVIWIIPQRELWDTYRRGNMTESQVVVESIDKFINDKKELEARELDDPSEEEIRKVYENIRKSRK